MEAIDGSIDLVRIMFLAGALLALAYKKKLGVTPGGIIVPGTLAIVLSYNFVAFLVVMLTSLLTWLVYKFAFGPYALRGRWPAFVNMALSLGFGLIILAITENMHILSQEAVLLSMIVPGLVALSARKYSLGKVMIGVLSLTTLTLVIGMVLGALIPYQALTYLAVQLAAYTPLALTNPYIVLPISLLSAAIIHYKFGIRGGGYLIAPFLAVVLFSSPWHALLVAAGVLASYGAVRLVQKYTLVIGLERFVLSLFCGYVVVTLMDLMAIMVNIPHYRPASLVLIIAIAVLTNDLTLQPVKKTIGKGFAPTFLSAVATKVVS